MGCFWRRKVLHEKKERRRKNQVRSSPRPHCGNDGGVIGGGANDGDMVVMNSAALAIAAATATAASVDFCTSDCDGGGCGGA